MVRSSLALCASFCRGGAHPAAKRRRTKNLSIPRAWIHHDIDDDHEHERKERAESARVARRRRVLGGGPNGIESGFANLLTILTRKFSPFEVNGAHLMVSIPMAFPKATSVKVLSPTMTSSWASAPKCASRSPGSFAGFFRRWRRTDKPSFFSMASASAPLGSYWRRPAELLRSATPLSPKALTQSLTDSFTSGQKHRA